MVGRSETSTVSLGRLRRLLPRTPDQGVGASAAAQASNIQGDMAQPRATTARRPPTTSSERGKAFRARRRIYKGQLQERLKVLEEEIRRLEQRKALMRGRLLQRRESSSGSLVRLVREYYTIFQFGMGDRQRALVDPLYARRNASEVAYKENFLRTVMAEDALTGDLVGPDASLMQWHFFSAAHAKLSVRIERVDIIGDPDDPFIDLYSTMDAVCGPQTLAILFPGSEKNYDLRCMFDNLRVAFPMRTRFKFDADGRICFEHVSSNLLEGYLRAGVLLDDVLELFKFMIVSPSLTVNEDVAKSTADPAFYRQASTGKMTRNIEPLDVAMANDCVGTALHTQGRENRLAPRHDRHWYIYDANV